MGDAENLARRHACIGGNDPKLSIIVNPRRVVVHIFAWKLVSRTSKQASRYLGPVWQPGVYNGENDPKLLHLVGFETQVKMPPYL